MDKNKARKILTDSGYQSVINVKTGPCQYLDKHILYWNIDIIIFNNTLQTNTNTITKLLLAGYRFKLKSNIELAEYTSSAGVFKC